MNALVEKAVEAISKLPEAEQEAIARDVLDRIAADACWDDRFADPRSERALSRLAAEARKEVQDGAFSNSDPSDRGEA